MDDKTLQRLANITTSFYNKAAAEFCQSRNKSWDGWSELLPIITKLRNKPIRVLDMACGNGRFAHFLSQKCPYLQFEYLGVDNNKQLLEFAKKQRLSDNINTTFQNEDIIQRLLQNQQVIPDQTFDIVVVFGFVHHIPSEKLRTIFFIKLRKQLNVTGICVITFWDFIEAKRLEKKQVDPNILGLDTNKLESGDYILDWQRGTAALRYANHTTRNERKKLVANSSLTLIKEFYADGKEKNLNHYLVLQK
ncbi:MAG: hypothetical protein COU67_01265 [Candidatus Pacebacteria bacterium CG10_big_fil_rev_8_21_14_0_10_44_54]|nr:MAG: hypothetical protein COU67_01265 [Candidatus Pacebacteria bacterium CG10_big_fil_rev_8_21_14_0_10_44_54]